jgi:hypothetical protein
MYHFYASDLQWDAFLLLQVYVQLPAAIQGLKRTLKKMQLPLTSPQNTTD